MFRKKSLKERYDYNGTNKYNIEITYDYVII